MNPDKPLNLMDELAQAGICHAKNDSFSQEYFTVNMNKDPVVRLNFSDMEDITSFNERNFQSSTPIVVPKSVPIESDDVTVDNHVFKGYTRLIQPSSVFQKNIKPASQFDTSEPSYQGVTLNLEQELQQVKSQNRINTELSLDDRDANNVGSVSLQPNVQHDKSQTFNNYKCPVTPDHSKDFTLPNGNVGLSLEQELQQTISGTDNACLPKYESPLKSGHDSSKNGTNIPLLESENESLNVDNFKTIKDTKAGMKDLLQPEDKMEASMFRKMLSLKQELEMIGNVNCFDKEIVENGSEVVNVSNIKCISSPKHSEEISKHVMENNCTPLNNNNGKDFEVLNTLDYLGFNKERLNSLSVSMTSNMLPNSIDQKESDEHVNDLSVESRDPSVGVGKKRNLKLDSNPSPLTNVSPQKRNKIDSEMKPSSSIFEEKILEIGQKQTKLLKDDLFDIDICKTNLDNERSDNAHLKIKVELLEKELKNQQQLTTQAAQLGMQVVEENNDLKEKIENLLTSIATAEEERKNEQHAMKLKLQNKDYMENQYNEEISYLKEEISQLKETLDTTEKEKTVLSQQLRSMEYSAEQSQLKEQQLTTTIEHLEKMLKEKVDQPFSSPTFNQTDDDTIEQINAMQQEIVDLQSNNTILKSQLISHEANIKRLEDELLLCQQCKNNKEQEIDEMKHEINSYYKAVESSKIDIKDLKAQLHAAQLQNMNPKDRGNSLFSEIEDRRVLAEKMVVTLKHNYETLKKNFNMEKQQHHKLKMQAVSLLQMNADKVSEDYARQLTSMLQDARSELKELQEKVNYYKRNEAQQAEKLVKIQETFGNNENRDVIEFLHSLNDIKQKELDKLKVKLGNVEMQYFQESSKVVDYIKKLRLTEEEVKSLHCNNMKLKLRIEELLMKFNPDELLEKSSPKSRIEKLPFGTIQNFPSSLIKDEPKAETSAEKPTKCKAQQIAELVYSGAINPIDLLDGSPKVKKKVVSMSSEVTIIDNDGKKEKKMNPDTENIPAKLERRRRPQGTFAPADKIIEVKSPVRKADCKQQ